MPLQANVGMSLMTFFCYIVYRHMKGRLLMTVLLIYDATKGGIPAAAVAASASPLLGHCKDLNHLEGLGG
jgi:hypothetical protein